VQLLREMLAMLREDVPVYRTRLNSALVIGDSAGVQHASHSLRGMLSIFGAEAAMQAALCLERMGHDGDLTEAAAQTEKLDDEINRFFKIASTRTAKLET
jgi:HPt (histidine-containing phosphotransfer) domain-containing protein